MHCPGVNVLQFRLMSPPSPSESVFSSSVEPLQSSTATLSSSPSAAGTPFLPCEDTLLHSPQPSLFTFNYLLFTNTLFVILLGENLSKSSFPASPRCFSNTVKWGTSSSIDLHWAVVVREHNGRPWPKMYIFLQGYLLTSKPLMYICYIIKCYFCVFKVTYMPLRKIIWRPYWLGFFFKFNFQKVFYCSPVLEGPGGQ